MTHYRFKSQRTRGKNIGNGAIVALVALIAHMTYALDLPVTNTNDIGAGSLREAISLARPGDRIVFNIPENGPVAITLRSGPLVVDTNNIEIDGYTQNGASEATAADPANLQIIIDGDWADFNGIEIPANNVRIKGLQIENFSAGIIERSGVEITGNNNTIKGSFICNNTIGINIDGSNNTIGGPTVADRVIASGNTSSGILIASSHCRIDNCYIGTNNTGNQAMANDNGIVIVGGSYTTIRDCVISGNNQNGLKITTSLESADHNSIIRTLIGTDRTGSQPLPNQGAGILFTSEDIAGDDNANVNDNRVEFSVIAFNGGMGINNHEGTALGDGNLFSANSMHSNADTAIFLQNSGNREQTAPVITSVASFGSRIRVRGHFMGAANANYRIEYFINETDRNPERITEGKQYIGFSIAQTNAAGRGTLENVELLTTGIPGHLVSATATNMNTGDTSEYSQNKNMAQRGRHV